MAENENVVKKPENRSISSQAKKDDLSGEIINTLETIEDDYSRFKNTINNLKNNLQSFMENTSYELGEVKQKTEQKAEKEIVEKKVEDVEGEIDEVDDRLNEVMREVGFGEEIDVSNIPPILLADIYQKILNDIIEELRDNLGNHEANLIIQEELENMRMRTSGSELFQYDGRDINIRNLVSSIENNLISSKQIHSTFQELVQKLSEKIPNYRPRNFRAMVNAEGLEFVITKTINLIEKTNSLEDSLYEIDKAVDRLEDNLENKQSEITSRISKIEEKIDQDFANKYTDLDYRLSEFEEMFGDLNIEEVSEGLMEVREKNELIEERVDNISSDFEMTLSIVQEDVNELKNNLKDQESPLTEDEKFVYYAIPNDGATLKKLEKEVADDVENVESKLESLCDKGKVDVEKRGRWTVYVRREEKSKEEDMSEEIEDIDYVEEVDGEEEGSKSDDELKEKKSTEAEEEVLYDEFSGIVYDEGFTNSIEKDEEEEMVEEKLKTTEEESDEIEEEKIIDSENLIMEKIPEDGCTIHHLDKQFEDYDKSEIEEILGELIEKNKVSTTKRNRWTIYLKQKEVE